MMISKGLSHNILYESTYDKTNMSKCWLGLADASVAVFKEYLRQIWLSQYNRGGGFQGSSGFEHIFLGEKDNTTIQGYHSWFKYYRDEMAGKVNYLGYLHKTDLGVVNIR